MFAWGYLIQFGGLCFSFLVSPEVSFSLPCFGEDEFSSAEHLDYSHFLGFKKIFNLFYLFIYGCVGSLLLCGLSLVAASRGYSLLTVCRLLIAAASPWGSRLLQGGGGHRHSFCSRCVMWMQLDAICIFLYMCFKYCSFILIILVIILWFSFLFFFSQMSSLIHKRVNNPVTVTTIK